MPYHNMEGASRASIADGIKEMDKETIILPGLTHGFDSLFNPVNAQRETVRFIDSEAAAFQVMSYSVGDWTSCDMHAGCICLAGSRLLI